MLNNVQYHCTICAVSWDKNHSFGDFLWNKSKREVVLT